MRRTLVILLFIAGLATAPLRAQGDGAPSEYVTAFLLSRKAEELEAAGDLRAALKTFRNVADTLNHLKQAAPDYQPEMREWRMKRTQESIDRVQGKMGPDAGNNNSGIPNNDGGRLGSPDDITGGPGVLPPLPGDNDGQPAPRTTAKNTRNPKRPVAAEDNVGGDPLAQVQNKIARLETQLKDANENLEAERSKNAELTEQLSTAVKDRTRAETERKKAQDLAEVYQKSVLELKTKGDTSGSRAKELETQLAAAKKANAEREAELHAAEERIDQLLARSRAVAKKAEEAGKLPTEIKTLQAKLEAEQKSKADLTTKLAGVTKERDDAREEITRLKTLNKDADKLMAKNTELMKQLDEAGKQIIAFKTDSPKRDQEIAALKAQVLQVQKELTASQDKNTSLQGEMTTLQKKVDEYTKQIAQYKADKTASVADRAKMEEENKMLQGIVMRVMQEDANRAQRRKLVQMEMDRQNIQSAALIKQISYLTQPVVNLTREERRLFKKPKIEVEDPNTLVIVRTEGAAAEPPKDAAKPGEPEPLPDAKNSNPAPAVPEAPTPASSKPAEPPAPEKSAGPSTSTPDAAKPGDMAKLDRPPGALKPGLPEKQPAGDDLPAVKTNTGGGVARELPTDVKPIAEQAKQMFDREKYPDAEKLYDKALAIAPTNMYLLSNKAVVQFRMGKLKQAEETFRKALAIAPEDHFCWGTLGIVQYSQGKYDDAVNSLTKSLAINPKNPTAHNYLGITAAQKGWLEAAEKELVTATQLDPKYADAWFNLAVTHTLKQPPNKVDGRVAYKKALELGAEADPAMEQSLK